MSKVDHPSRLIIISLLLSSILYSFIWFPAIQKAFAPFKCNADSSNKCLSVDDLGLLETFIQGSHSAGIPPNIVGTSSNIAGMSIADYAKKHLVSLVVVSLLLSGGLFVAYFWAPVEWQSISLFQQYRNSSSMTNTVQKDELEIALEEASMENKTLIIALVNKAYTEKDGMLDLFLQSFRLGENNSFLLNHTLLVAVDQISFDRCKLLQLHCYKLRTGGVDFSGEKLYMSDEFIKMMWSRTQFLGDVLRRGYNYIFTDTDVMWLRNPFLRLRQAGEYDLQISCDKFNGRPSDERNPINTGFYYVRSNNKTIALFDMWYSAKNNSIGMKEQDVLVKLISTGVLRQLGIKMRILDTRYMSGFCQSGRDVKEVVTMHSNCCRTINAKLIDLRAYLEDWKNFKRSSNTTAVGWTNHRECSNSWKA